MTLIWRDWVGVLTGQTGNEKIGSSMAEQSTELENLIVFSVPNFAIKGTLPPFLLVNLNCLTDEVT